MDDNKLKNLNLQLNWRFRFLLFLGVFVLSFAIARFLFKSDLDFSLFLSVMLGIFHSLSMFGGYDKYSLKNYFPEYNYQSFAYIKVNVLFYCPGRIVITEHKFVFITNKMNAKPNKIEIDFSEIDYIKSNKSIFIKKGLKLGIKDGQSLKFWWIEDISKCIEILENKANKILN